MTYKNTTRHKEKGRNLAAPPLPSVFGLFHLFEESGLEAVGQLVVASLRGWRHRVKRLSAILFFDPIEFCVDGVEFVHSGLHARNVSARYVIVKSHFITPSPSRPWYFLGNSRDKGAFGLGLLPFAQFVPRKARGDQGNAPKKPWKSCTNSSRGREPSEARGDKDHGRTGQCARAGLVETKAISRVRRSESDPRAITGAMGAQRAPHQAREVSGAGSPVLMPRSARVKIGAGPPAARADEDLDAKGNENG